MRPTIALAVIAKNEERNVSRLLESVHGCFDQIVFVDTGSTDRTVEIANKYGCEIHHFTWINDFSAARNFAFSKADCDFVCWLDLDDVLLNRDAFIKWRDSAMQFADMWLATYDYAQNADGTSAVNFARERVFRTSKEPVWRYFVHEGVVPGQNWNVQYITTWSVKHLRDDQDKAQDQNRNIRLLEERKNELDSRLLFYYGKELFEVQNFEKALGVLTEAATKDDAEVHDRILSLQYAAYSALFLADRMKPEHQTEKLMVAIQLAQQGTLLDPKRAEFYCIVGEAYCKMGKLTEALPYFGAAENCMPPNHGKYAGPIYTTVPCYGSVPALNKSKIYFHTGQFDLSEAEARKALSLGAKEAEEILRQIEKIKPLVSLEGPREEVGDIVFTCPPQSAYEFDEELYKTKPMGGSETALIQVAAWLKALTGRRVIVFNMREKPLVADSGVEYLPASQLNAYMATFRPAAHIAWRHNIKVTNAPTYLWCHDLITPTVEAQQNFDKIMCLSQFHQSYVQALQGVQDDNVFLTRNGLDPRKFDFLRPEKNPNKIVWMSSPDRGLERAMLVLDEVRKSKPGVELHVYYGLENLYKYGLGALADKLKGMMHERPWVIYHGFTEQEKMYREVADAVVWLHPCNFIESFCITALEMLTLGIFPITRRLGALENTLAEAEEKGQAILLDHDCVTENEIKAYARETLHALEDEKWKRVELDPETVSWQGVAAQWIEEMGLMNAINRRAS